MIEGVLPRAVRRWFVLALALVCAALALGAATATSPTPVSGGRLALRDGQAAAVVAANLLKNPSFELDADGNGKPDGWIAVDGVARSGAASYSGSYSMRHRSTQEASYITAQSVANIVPGVRYTFGAWTNIPATTDSFGYALELAWTDAAGRPIRVDVVQRYSAATGGWVQALGSYRAPAGVSGVVVRMRVIGLNATIYADSLVLRRQAATPTPTRQLSTTPSRTATRTATAGAATATRTATATTTIASTRTITASPAPSTTRTATLTAPPSTPTSTRTATLTTAPPSTPTSTRTATLTTAPTSTRTPTHTATRTRTATLTTAPVTPTSTRTPTHTATRTRTATLTTAPTSTRTPTSSGPVTTPAHRINAPHFSGSVPFAEAAVFWFGQVELARSYTDVRVGYTDQELYLYLAVFDRRLWYDTTPDSATLEEWDAATIWLDLSATPGAAPGASSYRLVAGLANQEARGPYQAAYRGSAAGWTAQPLAFTTVPGWRGAQLNDATDDRGWAMTYHIPFASLGLSGPPAAGTPWALGVTLHDRDEAGALPTQSWPPTLDAGRPASWGRLTFGLPSYAKPPLAPAGTLTIREKLNGAVVPDAAVGGGAICGEGMDFWTQWGAANYGNETTVNVQNQSDIADWPCFSKYYVTFPLSALPPGAQILSATLQLHQNGNAGAAGQAQRSLIQVSLVEADWNEATLTWNNAPLALENVSQAWVGPISGCGSTLPWPCTPRRWDLSRAVAMAHASRTPLRLALYSADDAYHSGKYFTSSESGDWNAVGRPTLTIVWAN